MSGGWAFHSRKARKPARKTGGGPDARSSALGAACISSVGVDVRRVFGYTGGRIAGLVRFLTILPLPRDSPCCCRVRCNTSNACLLRVACLSGRLRKGRAFPGALLLTLLGVDNRLGRWHGRPVLPIGRRTFLA